MRLTSKEIYKYQSKFSNLRLGVRPIIYENGTFQIHNIKESDLFRVKNILSRADFIQTFNQTSSRYNFNDFSFSNGFAEPKKEYDIRGILKEPIEEKLNEEKETIKYYYKGGCWFYSKYVGEFELTTYAKSDTQALRNLDHQVAKMRGTGYGYKFDQKRLVPIYNEPIKPPFLRCPSCGRFLNDAGECPICDLNDESILDENYAIDFDVIENGYAGYILPSGRLRVAGTDNEDNYHGSDSDEDKHNNYPEFSNTHPEDDTCIRIFEEPNEKQYKAIEKIADIYLDNSDYTKLEILDKNRKYQYYKVLSLYEDACGDDISPDEEIVKNWTGYDVVKEIKNYYRNVNEDIEIENTTMQSLINSCINNLRKIGYSKYLVNIESIPIKPSTSSRILGQCQLDKENLKQEIYFSRMIFKKELKDITVSIIYHELAHYIQNMICIEEKKFIFDENTNLFIESFNDSRDVNYYQGEGGHGVLWTYIAKDITEKLQLTIPITAYANDVMDTLIKNNKENIEGYVICRHCGYSYPLFFPDAVMTYTMENIQMSSNPFEAMIKSIVCPECFSELFFINNRTNKLYNMVNVRDSITDSDTDLQELINSLDDKTFNTVIKGVQ